MAVKGRPKFLISEAEILYAMEYTTSNKEAAEFLRVDRSVYKKFAEMYTHDGKTLYDLHRGIKKPIDRNFKTKGPTVSGKAKLIKILSGELKARFVPGLKAKILKYNIMPDYCSNCGYNERRMSDYSVPLKLYHVDGDKTNNKLENLDFLCHNCYYIFTNEIKKSKTAKRNLENEL